MTESLKKTLNLYNQSMLFNSLLKMLSQLVVPQDQDHGW